MSEHNHINYIEFCAGDLDKTKAFFSQVFSWEFTDYGPEYTAFSSSGIAGGFYQGDAHADAKQGSALVVLFSDNIENTQTLVEQAGGKITTPLFSFPGGRRFHFSEPSGNELAVWTH